MISVIPGNHYSLKLPLPDPLTQGHLQRRELSPELCVLVKCKKCLLTELILSELCGNTLLLL